MDTARVIDITLPLKEPMRGYKKSVAKSLSEDGWNASTLEIYSHAGTHMDAPLHFEAGDGTIDRIPPERLICNCHVLRLTSTVKKQRLTVNDLGKLPESIQPGEGIIFHTGWSNFKDDPSIYRDQLPGISVELAKWLVGAGVNIIGVEPPSIADVNNLDELQRVHRILLEQDVLILEGLCNLDSIQTNYGQLIALPLKIVGGDGAPVRALFIEKQLNK